MTDFVSVLLDFRLFWYLLNVEDLLYQPTFVWQKLCDICVLFLSGINQLPFDISSLPLSTQYQLLLATQVTLQMGVASFGVTEARK
jgi:hypothetical protein